MARTQQPLSKVWSEVALAPEVEAILSGLAAVSVGGPHDVTDLDESVGVVAGSFFPGTRVTLEALPTLRVVARLGIGVDNIDLDAATDLGICVTNTPDAPTVPVAEVAVGLMISLLHHLHRAHVMTVEGHWATERLIGRELAGVTVGLVGLGRTGARVAQLLTGFGSQVIAFDPYLPDTRFSELGVERCADLDRLLPRSDVVSLHLPATPANRHLMDGGRFALMRPGSVIVNLSRGSLLDEAALLEALRSGRIVGAALDVWDPEPPRADNPLLAQPGVIATPHIGAATSEGRLRSSVEAVSSIRDVLEGVRPTSLVNPEVWARRRR